MSAPERTQWKSRLGFVLAASGSAIGLGNIVFFGANAYKFGGGAFYVPYLVALFVVGIPMMILEFGIGHRSRLAFPQTLGRMAGRAGEFVGWWALFNAVIITMYYVTILGWVVGMLIGALGPLWEPTSPMPNYAMRELANPTGYFFDTLSSWTVVGFVALVWLANIAICINGARSIESTVKFFVPAMWIMMLALIVRGLTLDGGFDGVMYLFNPDFSAMSGLDVWRGAFSQIFFSLSLGFGVLSVYASYLPKKSDTTSMSLQTALMNCSFEYIAGFAIFSMLFAFAIVPQASTLAMSFFVLPQGIAQLHGGAGVFGVLFFGLLLVAGLSSSVSLVEGLAAAAIDKFRVKRSIVLSLLFGVGLLGSMLFALPIVIDTGLEKNGTLGLTLLDLFDHKAFGYGLLLVGLAECVVVAWIFGAQRLVDHVNRHTKFKLGTGYVNLIQFIIPLTIAALLVLGFLDECGVLGDDGSSYPYGQALVDPETIGTSGWGWVADAVPIAWIAFTVLGAIVLTALPAARRDDEEDDDA